jgi:hypothetical protein
VNEETRRAVHMKLCKSGTAGANLLYCLGRAAKHWTGWDDLLPGKQAELVQQILARAFKARGEGGRKSMTDETRRAGNRASRVSRTGTATSRFETMFERLRALQGETTSLPPVVTTWFEATLSDLEKVTGPTARSKALRALGILRLQDYKDFHRLFRKSGGYKKAPADPALKAAHKAKHLQEIMKFIKEHPLPSQKKRKVVGEKGEEERLLTVLWYDQQYKALKHH